MPEAILLQGAASGTLGDMLRGESDSLAAVTAPGDYMLGNELSAQQYYSAPSTSGLLAGHVVGVLLVPALNYLVGLLVCSGSLLSFLNVASSANDR